MSAYYTSLKESPKDEVIEECLRQRDRAEKAERRVAELEAECLAHDQERAVLVSILGDCDSLDELAIRMRDERNEAEARVAELERELSKRCGCGWTGDKEYTECADHAALRTRTEKLEHDLAEARAEVGRLRNPTPEWTDQPSTEPAGCTVGASVVGLTVGEGIEPLTVGAGVVGLSTPEPDKGESCSAGGVPVARQSVRDWVIAEFGEGMWERVREETESALRARVAELEAERDHAVAECDRLASDTYWIDRAMQAERTLETVREKLTEAVGWHESGKPLGAWILERAAEAVKLLDTTPTPAPEWTDKEVQAAARLLAEDDMQIEFPPEIPTPAQPADEED